MIRQTLAQLDLSRQSDGESIFFSQNQPVYDNSRPDDSQNYLASQPLEICARAIESKEIIHELNRLESNFEENLGDVTRVIDDLSDELKKANKKRRRLPDEIAMPKLLKKICEDNARMLNLYQQLLESSHDLSKIMDMRLHRIEATIESTIKPPPNRQTRRQV